MSRIVRAARRLAGHAKLTATSAGDPAGLTRLRGTAAPSPSAAAPVVPNPLEA